MAKNSTTGRSRTESPAATKAPTTLPVASGLEESPDSGKPEPQRVTLSEAASLAQLELGAYRAAQAYAQAAAQAAALDALKRRDNGTALESARVINPLDFGREAFSTVSAQLERERAAMKSASPTARREPPADSAAVPDVKEGAGITKANEPTTAANEAPRRGGDTKPTNGKAGSRLKDAKVTINLRMLDALTKDGERHGWSARQWATSLSCAVSTVQGTTTWKNLMKMRDNAKQERAQRQSDQTNGM